MLKKLTLVIVFILLAPSVAFSEVSPSNKNSSKLSPLTAIGGKKANSKDPLLVKSDTLQVDSVGNRFIYKGHVRAVRGDTVITADKLTGTYNAKNELENVLCEHNVVITRANNVRASSERAFYNVAKSTIELTENPELINQSSALSADKITMFLDEDRSEAEGDVRVKVINEKEEKKISPETKALLSD